MTELRPVDILEVLELVQSSAMKDQRYHDAMVSGFLGYLAIREKKDEPFEKASLIGLRVAIDNYLKDVLGDSLQSSSEQPACSFCGRGEPDVHLAAGPQAYICNSCVTTLSSVFAGKSGK